MFMCLAVHKFSLWNKLNQFLSAWRLHFFSYYTSHLSVRAPWCHKLEGTRPKTTIRTHSYFCCRKPEKRMSQTSILHHLSASGSRIYRHDLGSVMRCLVLIHIQLKSTLNEGVQVLRICFAAGWEETVGICRLHAADENIFIPPNNWSLSLRWSFRSRRWEEVSYLVLLRSNYIGYIS